MIDMKKTYQTRNGMSVRLLCTDGPNKTVPIIGIVGNSIIVTSWYTSGTLCPTFLSPYDLVEVKPKIIVERWINFVLCVNSGEIFTRSHKSKAEAEAYHNDPYVKVLARAMHVRWEGEESK